MAKQHSRLSEIKSGRSAPGLWKGNSSNSRVTVKESLSRAGAAKKIGDVRGPAGQDGKLKLGGAGDREHGGFDNRRK